MYLMRAIGFVRPISCPHAGQYLQSFDFEYRSGTGKGEFTHNPNHAKKFPSPGAVLEYWRTVSRTVPRRFPDGAPNRPLSCLTIEAVPLALALKGFSDRPAKR